MSARGHDVSRRATLTNGKRAVQWIVGLALLVGPACAFIPEKPVAAVNVHGRVTDAMNRPVAGVYVYFEPVSKPLRIGFRGVSYAETDSSGAYEVGLASGTWIVNFAAPQGVAQNNYTRHFSVTVSPEHSALDYVIHAFRVEGRVLGPTGAMLDSAFVSAFGDSEYASASIHGGRYSYLLASSTYRFYASSTASYDGLPQGRITGVPIHADTTVDIVLEGNPITGIVSGPGGAPLESVGVVASADFMVVRARTGSDGRYTLYIPPGNYRFVCESGPLNANILARTYPIRSVNAAATIDLDMSGVQWTGTVHSSATMAPVAGARITATMFGDAFGRLAVSVTDAFGGFRLILEPNREYSLEFSAAGVAGLTYPSIIASADSVFDVALDPAPIP